MNENRTPPGIDPARRRWLQALAASPVLAGATAAPLPALAAVKTNARIVIAGSGLGGIAVANRLARLLDGAKITIVDRKEEHNYQPGYTLVATGVWPVEKVRDRNADHQPAGVAWVKDLVAGFDPTANTVVTAGGQRTPCDVLVVATGVHLDYAQIEGMDVGAIGGNGLTSVYPSPQAAQATWAAMQAYTAKGGNAVMTLPATPLKCAGAPLKMSFMLRDRLFKAGTLGRWAARRSADGYTSCPLITREGSAMLIEFDCEGRLTPSLPMIEPLNDSFFAWLMNYRMLKPAYMAVLKGQV